MTPPDVFRETPAPPPPPAAAEAFGATLPTAERYAALLAGAGVARGLIGPREAARLWERHLLNCVAISADCPPQAQVCDVGSGAGLPGIVLALARPDLHITLLEPLLRRTTFLREAVEVLGLPNAAVVRARAKEHGHELSGPGYDVVTARAVAPLTRLAGWTLPLCRPGGTLLALKGASAATELAAAAPVLRHHSARSWDVRSYRVAGVAEPVLAVRVVAGEGRVIDDDTHGPGLADRP